MGFSRQEYWSGLPFLLQGIFLTQGSNPGLLPYRQILYHLSHQGSPCQFWREANINTCFCLHLSHIDIFSEHKQAFHPGSVNELPLIRVVWCVGGGGLGGDGIFQSLHKTALYPGVCKACASASRTLTNSRRETEPPSVCAVGREPAPGDREVL